MQEPQFEQVSESNELLPVIVDEVCVRVPVQAKLCKVRSTLQRFSLARSGLNHQQVSRLPGRTFVLLKNVQPCFEERVPASNQLLPVL